LNPDLSTDRYLEALGKDRCPLCFLTASSSIERLKSFLSEYVNDPKVRKTLSASNGFCRRHAWQAVSSGNNAVGVGLVHHALLTEGLEKIGKNPSGFPLFKKTKAPEECPLCSWESHVDDNFSRQFAACWADSPKLREEFDKNGILCLHHLETALRWIPKGAAKDSLAAEGRKALERLLVELKDFLDKQDYRRSHEKDGGEWDSWIRAVRMMVGEKGVF